MDKKVCLPVILIFLVMMEVPASPSRPLERMGSNVKYHPWGIILSTNNQGVMAAAIPDAIYHYNNTVYISPLLSLQDVNTTKWFLNDWTQTIRAHDIKPRLKMLGIPSESELEELYIATGTKIRPIYNMSDPVLGIDRIVNDSWQEAENVVLMPYMLSDTHSVSFSRDISFNAENSVKENKTISPGNTTIYAKFDYPYVQVMARSYAVANWLKLITNDTIVDYFMNTPEGFLSGIAPVLNGTPMILSGNDTFDITIAQYPSKYFNLTINKSATFLRVSTKCATDVDIYLLKNGETILSSAGPSGDEKIAMPYPPAGNYTLVVVLYQPASVDVKVDISIEYKESINTLSTLVGNTPIIASSLNAPLLLCDSNNVSEDTLWTIKRLNPSDIWVASWGIANFSSIQQRITNFGITGTLHEISNLSDMLDVIKSAWDNETIIISSPLQAGAAALMGARYGAPVLLLPDNVRLLATATGDRYNRGSDIESYKDSSVPHFYLMQKFANAFEEWLGSLGISARHVEIVASLWEIPPSADRALLGAYLVGRIPADNASQALTIITRELHHELLVRDSSPLGTFFAYVHNLQFSLVNGENVTVTDERVHFQTVLNGVLYAGIDEIVGTLKRGTSYWHVSTHGAFMLADTSMYNRTKDPGEVIVAAENAPWGYEGFLPDMPDLDGNGIVDGTLTLPSFLLSGEYIDTYIGSLHSMAVFLGVCLVGSTRFPLTLMRHGTDVVIASPRTVSFDGTGYLSLQMIDAFDAGKIYSEALNETLWVSSTIYTRDTSQVGDHTLQFILFGDSHISAKDNAPQIVTSSPSAHLGKITPVPYAVGMGAAEAMKNAGFDCKVFLNNNLSDFWYSIHEASLILLDAGEGYYLNLDYLERYVFLGGTLAILNATGELPFNASTMPCNFEAITANISHPLLYNPYDLSARSYNATVSLSAPDWFIPLAFAGNCVAWVAGTTDLGRITIATSTPDLNQTIENIVAWSDSRIPRISNITFLEYFPVSWLNAVKVVYMKFTVTDEYGNSLLSSVSINIRCGNIRLPITVEDNYVILELPSGIKEIEIHISSCRENEINPRTFCLKVNGGASSMLVSAVLLVPPMIFLIGVVWLITARKYEDQMKTLYYYESDE